MKQFWRSKIRQNWIEREHKSKTGIGPLSNPEAKGLKVHTVLAASIEGVPLGVLHQKVWVKTFRKNGRGLFSAVSGTEHLPTS